jgi:predicted ATPase
VPATVAQALGLEDRQGRQLVDLVRGDVRGRRMLVFDNCEHLLERCARLIDALQQRVGALLRERIAGDELERLLAEGGAMSEDEAWRIALEQ